MSDFGVITLKFSITSERLLDFNHALDLMRDLQKVTQQEIDNSRVKLLDILVSLDKVVDGGNSKFTYMNGYSIVEILKQKHGNNWNDFVTQIRTVIHKLNDNRPSLSIDDVTLLDDIADAIDAECALLFRRMSNRS